MIRTTALAAALIFSMVASLSAFAAEDAKPDLAKAFPFTAENVKPDLAKAKSIAETVCVACHGADGNSAVPANPILAGQGSAYLLKQLTEFKAAEGKPAVRKNDIMGAMTATLSGEDMQSLALYFSQQKPKPSAAVDAKRVALGQTIWRKGDFDRGVPACAGCHGPAGAGLPTQYPRLSGQYAEYTETQLKNFRSEERSNDAASVMRTIADKLSDKQIKAVADYIAGVR